MYTICWHLGKKQLTDFMAEQTTENFCNVISDDRTMQQQPCYRHVQAHQQVQTRFSLTCCQHT